MINSTCGIRPPHDAALSDAVYAIRILTSASNVDVGKSVPAGYERAGNVLFGASAMMTGGQARMDTLAEHYLCDVVDIVQDEDGSYRCRLGVRRSWIVDWHDHDYRLWRPSHGGVACFVSADPSHIRWFYIEDGGLWVWEEDQPWRNQQEREAGLRLGAAALHRLAGVR